MLPGILYRPFKWIGLPDFSLEKNATVTRGKKPAKDFSNELECSKKRRIPPTITLYSNSCYFRNGEMSEDQVQTKIQEIRRRLNKKRRQLQFFLVLKGAGEILSALFLYFFCVFLLDFLVPDIPGPIRLMFLGGGVALAGFFTWNRIVKPLQANISELDIAQAVEETYPELEDRLVSSLEFSRELQQESSSRTKKLKKTLMEQGIKDFENIDFQHVFSFDSVYEWIGKGALSLLFVTLFVVGFPTESSIFASRLMGLSTNWPKVTHIEPLYSSPREVVTGNPVKLGVSVRKNSKEVPDQARVFIRKQDGTEQIKSIPKSKNNEGTHQFVHEIPSVRDSFTYYIVAGDDRTKTRRVKVYPRPRIDGNLRVFYRYPDYTNLEDTKESNPKRTRKIDAPFRTNVRVQAPLSNDQTTGRESSSDSKTSRIQSNIEEVKAVLKISEEEEEIPATLVRGEQNELYAETTFDLKKSGILLFQMRMKGTNQNKKKSGANDSLKIRSQSFPLRVRSNEPPFVKIQYPGMDEKVTKTAEYPIEARIKDDYGIAQNGIQLNFSFPDSDREKREIVLDEQYNNTALPTREVSSKYTVSISELGLQEGDVMNYTISARDQDETTDPTTSRKYQFHIVKQADLEKNLQNLQIDIRREIEKIRNQQKSLNKDMDKMLKKISSSDDLSKNIQDQMGHRRNRQMTLRQRLSRTMDKLKNVYRSGKYNKLWNEQVRTQLKKLYQTGSSIHKNAMEVPITLLARGLSEVSPDQKHSLIQKARNNQKEIVQRLNRLLQEMRDWESFAGMVRSWQEIIRSQKEIIEKVKED